MRRFSPRSSFSGRVSPRGGSKHEIRSDALARFALFLPVFVAEAARAFSAGSPICEVHSLPLVEMSPTLAQPPPTGWSLKSDREVFYAGQPLTIRLHHPDSTKAVRGVLLWAKSSPTEGAGHFELPANGRWQYMPGSSNCAAWALSHTDGLRKEQALLVWTWWPGSATVAVMQAFLIEDCPQPPGGCRDQQGLTPMMVLERGIFADDFEA